MIKTGKDPISTPTYIAIMSVCFIINLPGIAIAPIEGKLISILGTSELAVQLLTTIPNFVIIPFVLLTGKLSMCRHKIPWIIGSLILYLGCGIGYLFADSVLGLIIVSSLLGCANGILIPFAMGLVVNTFYGKYRTRHLGVKSAVSNIAVVGGSFLVGYLIGSKNWHLPFLIYIAAIIPIIFCYWLKYVPSLTTKNTANSNNSNNPAQGVKDINMKRVWAIIGNNVTFSFIAISIVIYLPQLIQNYGWKPVISGDISAIFFIFVLLAGFCLLPFVRLLKQYTFCGIGIFLLTGFGFITFGKSEWSLFLGASFAGIAFGIFQPFIYDKTSYTVTNPVKTILALSYALTALYIAIAVEPFIITGVCKLFHINDENSFVFKLGFFLSIGYVVIAYTLRKKFAFSVEKEYINEPDVLN